MLLVRAPSPSERRWADSLDEAKAAFRAVRWDVGGLGITPSQKSNPPG
jgi:hypothetical protein